MIPKKDCWVVVSAYNEERHIARVVSGVRKKGFSRVVVVDDGSSDGTSGRARDAGAVVLRHVINMHKGAAMLTGSEYAIREGARAIVYMDGDGQHEPAELPKFLDALNSGSDIVFGARRVTRNMPIARRLGKILTGISVQVLFGLRIHDVLSGYRALTVEAFGKVRWRARDYAVESEMIARAGKAGLSYSEITISTIYHDRYKGVTALHGIVILLKMLWWKLTLWRG